MPDPFAMLTDHAKRLADLESVAHSHKMHSRTNPNNGNRYFEAGNPVPLKKPEKSVITYAPGDYVYLPRDISFRFGIVQGFDHMGLCSVRDAQGSNEGVFPVSELQPAYRDERTGTMHIVKPPDSQQCEAESMDGIRCTLQRGHLHGGAEHVFTTAPEKPYNPGDYVYLGENRGFGYILKHDKRAGGYDVRFVSGTGTAFYARASLQPAYRNERTGQMHIGEPSTHVVDPISFGKYANPDVLGPEAGTATDTSVPVNGNVSVQTTTAEDGVTIDHVTVGGKEFVPLEGVAQLVHRAQSHFDTMVAQRQEILQLRRYAAAWKDRTQHKSLAREDLQAIIERVTQERDNLKACANRGDDIITTLYERIEQLNKELADAKPLGYVPTDDQLRQWWKQNGGSFHGPNVETGFMPERKLLTLLRLVITSDNALKMIKKP